MMRSPCFGKRLQIEVFPYFNEFAIFYFTHENNGQLKLCTYNWFMC